MHRSVCEIAIGLASNELPLCSVKWVLNNSRPCPNCRYPIEKSGGCNHMRCQRCQCYFCFQCGGEGQLCMAFYCQNTPKHWHEDADEGSCNGLTNLVDKFGAYRTTNAKLTYLIQTLANKSAKSPTVDQQLEIQCHQVLLWIHSSSVSRMMTTNSKNITVTTSNSKNIIGTISLQLELILHALSLRSLMQQASIKPSERGLVAVLGLRQKERMSYCKQKAKERREQRGKEDNAFKELFVDQELIDLCKMDASGFAQKVKEAIHEGIQSLRPPAAHNTRRRCKNNNNKETAMAPLNQKQSRSNNPWRKGLRLNHISDERADWSDDGNRSNKRSDRWKKNKTQVVTRRAIALGLNGV